MCYAVPVEFGNKLIKCFNSEKVFIDLHNIEQCFPEKVLFDNFIILSFNQMAPHALVWLRIVKIVQAIEIRLLHKSKFVTSEHVKRKAFSAFLMKNREFIYVKVLKTKWIVQKVSEILLTEMLPIELLRLWINRWIKSKL